MKRDQNLHPLSRDHHHALMSVVLTRRQIADGASLAVLKRIASEFAQFHREALLPHFRHEEEWVIPRYLCHVAEDDPMVMRLLKDHVALHSMVCQLGRAGKSGEELATLLSNLVDRLEEHVRFEERGLFPRVEAVLSAQELEEIGRALHEMPAKSVIIPGGDGSRVNPAPEAKTLDF